MGSVVVALHNHHAIVGEDFWADVSTGNWATDCLKGRQRAELFTGNLRHRDDIHPYFIQSMKAMMGKGVFGGVEVGFFQRLMELALVGEVHVATGSDARK